MVHFNLGEYECGLLTRLRFQERGRLGERSYEGAWQRRKETCGRVAVALAALARHFRPIWGYTDRFGRVHRAKAPHSVRALYGTNKQANAAHGADSPEAARREISLIFGAEFVEPQDQEPSEAAEEKAAV